MVVCSIFQTYLTIETYVKGATHEVNKLKEIFVKYKLDSKASSTSNILKFCV